jgi:quinol-cytochrome oxidoreductase complex cytochrome b subunit
VQILILLIIPFINKCELRSKYISTYLKIIFLRYFYLIHLFWAGSVSKPAEPPFVQIGQIANYNLFFVFYHIKPDYNLVGKKIK